ncbi:MAG: YkgJ family cysteine cluster protein, partial [Methanosarcina mazei]|nr:YkgJ family cysteine cluster protein [Methanosarcina mazei]
MYLQDRSPYMENSGSSNDRNSGKTEYQLTLIDALKKEIEIARRLDPEKLA